jgi:DNA polymerase III delta prime subunit
MSEQQQAPSSQNDHLPWWILLCRWLWKLSAFLGTSVFLALSVNLASTWLTTPEGALPANTPLSTLMTNWPISLLVGCCLLLLALIFWAISRWSLPSSTTTAITPQNRKRMLKRLRVRYEQSLAQSLLGAIQIELGLASRPAAIQNAVSLSLRLPEQPEQALPTHTSIVDAYEQAQQELLILGEPGAGKSTLLLELAQHLVEQAEQNAEQPLPVLLPLSSWATKRLPLQEWLIEQFTLLYVVPRQLSHDWVRADLVLPLLDGLDEMDEAARAACIAAINTYHREHLHPLVICSRTNEHAAATVHERLALHTAVVVQPLTLEQIDAYLTTIGKPLATLRTALEKNATLQILATTPLLLQILILTYHGVPIQTLSHKEGQLREQILTNYVQQMVNRKGNNARYPLEQTRAWLSWLAQQMLLQNQTIFSLEQVQPNWLPRRRRAIYQWNVGLLFELIFGLFFGLVGALVGALVYELVFGLVFGLIFGLVFGLIFGLVFGPLRRLDTIKPAEALTWSRKGLKYGLIYGLVGLLVGGLLGPLGEPLGLLGGLIGVLGGLSRTQLTERLRFSPNEGIRRSMKNGLLVGLLIGLFGGLFGLLLGGLFGLLIGGLLVGLLVGVVNGLFGGLFFGLFFGLPGGLFFGLQAVLQHYILRFWLWRSHLFPLQAVPFLEDATARILLRRVGGGYSFTHRLLLDYFADLKKTSSAPSINAHLVQPPPLP